MSRRVDPARIETARRAATIARLVSGGRTADAAAAIVAEWEAAHAGRDDASRRSAWEQFDRWLEERRSGP